MVQDLEPVKIHCWECRRRRLVCDSTRPACTRCVTTQVDCPGYGKTKPLRWRKPVQVSTYSKHRVMARRPKDGAKAGLMCCGGAAADPRQLAGTTPHLEPFFSQLKPLKTEDIKAIQVMWYCKQSPVPTCQEALGLLMINLVRGLPVNSRVFPNYTPLLQLIPRLQIFELLLSDIRKSLPCTNNVIACWALGHRINQMPQDVSPSILSSAWSTYYSHRGEVIRSLTEGVGENDQIRRASALVHLALFLLVEVSC